MTITVTAQVPEKGETKMILIEDQYGFQRDDSTFALGVYDKIARFSGEGFLVKIGAKCGFVNNEGDLIIPVVYDYLSRMIPDHVTVKKDDKEGLINYQGKMIFACEYDKIRTSPGNGILLIKERKMGLFSISGSEILPIKYDLIEGFPASNLSEKHYLVKENGLIGVATAKALIVPIKFEEIYENNGLFIVKSADLYGLYSVKAEELLQTTYDRIYNTVDKNSTIVIAAKDGKLGIVNNQGNKYFLEELSAIQYVQNSENLNSPYTPNKKESFLSLQGKGGKWGVFNEYNSTLTVPIIYDAIVQKVDLSTATYFIVQKGNKMGVINSKNDLLIPFDYEQLEFSFMRPSSDKTEADICIIAKKKKAVGLIDLTNKTLIPFEYEALAKISLNDVYKAKTKAGYVLINIKNELLNAGPFDQVGDFNKGLALTFKGDSMRQMNENCQLISEAKAMHYHEGFRTFKALKLALIKSLNSKDDQLLHDFAQKITPSKHILFLFSKITHTYAYVEYLSPKTISKRYYEVLLEVKRRWNGTKYDKNNLIAIEDYTVFEGRVYTNQRSEKTTFGMRELEWILKDAIRMDGFWVSTFFLKHSFK